MLKAWDWDDIEPMPESQPKRHRGSRVRDPIDADIARRVRDLRMYRGMRQQDVAAQAGVTYQQLHKWEKGINRITFGALKKLADALGVSPAYFFDNRLDDLSLLGRNERGKLNFYRSFQKLPTKTQKAVMRMVSDLARDE